MAVSSFVVIIYSGFPTDLIPKKMEASRNVHFVCYGGMAMAMV